MPTALIVEDEPEANRLLSLLVQLRGYQTQSAFTGDEALRMVERKRPDVVFLDLMLPDRNGYDICQTLKSTRTTSGIPIVMVTARVAEENRLMSYRMGATDFVSKPYAPDQIFDAMSAADTWKRSIEAAPSAAGDIDFDSRSDIEPFEQIGRLQSVLLARTPWEEAAVLEFGRDLITLAQNLSEWGRRHRLTETAILRYELHPDRLTLAMRDLGGWFAADDLPHQDGLGLLIDAGRFDTVSSSDSDREVVMTKRLPRAEKPAEPS